MLVLVLQIGGDSYAIEGRRVLEVVPRVALRPVAKAPAIVAGLAVWRGVMTPVIDLVQLLRGEPCPERMSSRIVVVGLHGGAGAAPKPVGLLAEHVSDARHMGAEAFRDPGLRLPEAPYLGGIAREGDRLTQLIDPDTLLPPALRELLAAPGGTAALEVS